MIVTVISRECREGGKAMSDDLQQILAQWSNADAAVRVPAARALEQALKDELEPTRSALSAGL